MPNVGVFPLLMTGKSCESPLRKALACRIFQFLVGNLKWLGLRIPSILFDSKKSWTFYVWPVNFTGRLCKIGVQELEMIRSSNFCPQVNVELLHIHPPSEKKKFIRTRWLTDAYPTERAGHGGFVGADAWIATTPAPAHGLPGHPYVLIWYYYLSITLLSPLLFRSYTLLS